jgi:dihydrofolate reductase
VVTRSKDYVAAGAEAAGSLDEALARVDRPPPAFCIGGGELYRAALPLAATVYVTEIDHDFEGDTSFPPLDRAVWREASRERHARSTPDGYDYAFVTYVRRDAGRP